MNDPFLMPHANDELIKNIRRNLVLQIFCFLFKKYGSVPLFYCFFCI